MFRILKSYMLPIAMTLGILFSDFFSHYSGIIPYLLFTMLFVTYCKVEIEHIRFTKLHYLLVAIQLVGSVAVYAAIAHFSETVAQATMICVLAPTATAAVVITGMLGGDLLTLTAYTLISNLAVAIAGPLIFAVVGSHPEIPFFETFYYILKAVFPMLAFPIVAAVAVRRFLPRLHSRINQFKNISFYLWAVALVVVLAKTIHFIKLQPKENYVIDIWMAIASLVVCIAQFLIGRKIGFKYQNTVAGGQGLGQKNTVLAIWMAQAYLNPITSIGPGTYIIWQNSVNSFQLWLRHRGKI